MANIGKIISARGPVIDIAFASEDKLPRLNTAIHIQNGEEELVCRSCSNTLEMMQ